MKTKTMLKSFTDLLLKMVRPEAAKPAQAAQTPEPTSEQQLQQALLLIETEENSDPIEYRHWGLNE